MVDAKLLRFRWSIRQERTELQTWVSSASALDELLQLWQYLYFPYEPLALPIWEAMAAVNIMNKYTL